MRAFGEKKRNKSISHGIYYLSWVRLIHGPTEGRCGVVLRRAASPLGSEWNQGLPVVSVSIALCGEDSGQI